MQRLKISHLKSHTTSPQSTKNGVRKSLQTIHVSTKTNGMKSYNCFATATILFGIRSRTNIKTPSSEITVNSRHYFTRRKEKRSKSKPPTQTVEEEAAEPQQEEPQQEEREPKFTATNQAAPEFNSFVKQALSLMETNPQQAIMNAAMAYESLNNSGAEKEEIALGYLTCKEIMASSYMRMKDFDSAQKAIDDMLNIQPNSFRACVKRGRIYYDLGDYKNADAWFAKAINEIPTEPKTYIRRGYALIKLGKTETAHDIFEQGLRLIGDDPRLLYWKALGLSGIQQNSEAAQVLGKCAPQTF